jgi:hypothetical protein
VQPLRSPEKRALLQVRRVHLTGRIKKYKKNLKKPKKIVKILKMMIFKF